MRSLSPLTSDVHESIEQLIGWPRSSSSRGSPRGCCSGIDRVERRHAGNTRARGGVGGARALCIVNAVAHARRHLLPQTCQSGAEFTSASCKFRESRDEPPPSGLQSALEFMAPRGGGGGGVWGASLSLYLSPARGKRASRKVLFSVSLLSRSASRPPPPYKTSAI